MTAITELLNMYNLIMTFWVLVSWGLINLIAVYICIRVIDKVRPNVWFKIPAALSSVIPLLLSIIAVVILLGIVTLAAPPNTLDSMSYHMSRVMHWIQNKNIEHYPTHITRQLFLQPWAEFAIMQFQIMSGGDRFANLVQWFSMVGSLLGVSLIAKHFGANLRTQIFTAVIAVTIPMGILQASSTQNDYVVSFWLTCFVYYLLCLKRQPVDVGYSILAGLSLGLALLTKATAYLYCLPFLLWVGIYCFKKTKINALKSFSIIILLIFLINGSYYCRNYEVFGHPLGEASHRKINFNALMTPPAIASNIIRNISMHCGLPDYEIRRILQHGVVLAHTLLNIDVNDSRTTFGDTKFTVSFNQHVDSAGNFVHFILFALAALYYFFFLRRKKYKVGYYAISVVAAFIILCVLIKWNPWNSRYHLPMFILGAPFIAITLSEIQNQFKQNKKVLMFIWAIFLCIVAAVALYGCFGHKFIAAMYQGRSVGFLNKIIEGQAVHPLAYYFYNANNVLGKILGMAVCFLLGLIFLYRSKRDFINLTCLILILVSIPWVFYNQSAKLMGAGNIFTVTRIDQYFANCPELKDTYVKAIDYLKSRGCSNIGIILPDGGFEYQFFALLQKSNPQGFCIEHVNVNNASAIKYNTYPFNSFGPCAIISVGIQDNEVVYKNVAYVKKWSSDPVSVFIKR